MLSFSLGRQRGTTLDNNKIIKLSLLSVLSFSFRQQRGTTVIKKVVNVVVSYLIPLTIPIRW